MLSLFQNVFTKKPMYDDNITIIEGELSNYLSSIDRSKSSSTYTNYLSDYETEIDLDKPVKNKLINIESDENDIFKLKHNFYSNYGYEAYTCVLEKYNSLKDIYIRDFYDNIWDKSVELYVHSLNKDKKNSSCFNYLFAIKNNTNNPDVKDIYNTLFNIHINSIKSKLWIDCCKEFTHNLDSFAYH